MKGVFPPKPVRWKIIKSISREHVHQIKIERRQRRVGKNRGADSSRADTGNKTSARGRITSNSRRGTTRYRTLKGLVYFWAPNSSCRPGYDRAEHAPTANGAWGDLAGSSGRKGATKKSKPRKTCEVAAQERQRRLTTWIQQSIAHLAARWLSPRAG